MYKENALMVNDKSKFKYIAENEIIKIYEFMH